MRPTLVRVSIALSLALTVPAFALTPAERIDILWERASRQIDYEKYDDALASALLATRIDPRSPSAWALLAQVRWYHPDTPRGAMRAAARRACELDATSALAHYALGVALWSRDLDAAAAELEEAVRLDPGLARAWSMLGLVRVDQDDTEGALEATRRAVEIEPGYYMWHTHLGIALAEAWRLEEGIASDRRAVELAFSPFGESLARNNLAWGILLLAPEAAELRAEALANARRAVQLAPEDEINLDTLGCAELLYGTPQAAEVALRAGIAGGNVSYSALAYALALQGREAEAREVLTGAAALLTPADAWVEHAYFAALAWEALGRPEVTRRIAAHMLATWPEAPWTRQIAALVEER